MIRPNCPDPRACKRPTWTDWTRYPYEDSSAELWVNGRYQVTKRTKTIRVVGAEVVVVVLGISNFDQSAWHDWRDFQRIKNELAGPELVAFEVYPEESKRVDPSNFFLLWCLPAGSLDCGLRGRLVTDTLGLAPQRRLSVSE
jgi:hypothetical protein